MERREFCRQRAFAGYGLSTPKGGIQMTIGEIAQILDALVLSAPDLDMTKFGDF